MIVYREAGRVVATAGEFAALRRAAAAGDALDFLVRLGELEQAVADALHPCEDGWTAVDAAFRRASLGAASAFLAADRGRASPAALRSVLAPVAAFAGALPARVVIRPPEGYAHYALDPGGYARAAAAYRLDAGAVRAARAVVIGVRSIGTSLSAVVAAAVGSDRTATVRPRGASGERRVAVDAALARRVLDWARDGADVLVVDEGPGATGETFAAVAAWLRELGVDDRRVVIFPSRAWGMPLAPPERAAWFGAVRKFPPPVGDDRPERVAARFGLESPVSLCAGRWRELVPGTAGFPACAGHERVKYRASRRDGGVALLRFAGLGRWGADAAERAERLARLRAGPDVLGLDEGFLVLGWIDGAPLARRAGRDPAFLAAAARYLAARAAALRTGRGVDREPILEMLRANAAEAMGPAAPGLGGALRRLERLPPAEAVIADARLQRREWIRTPAGFTKVDAIDHGDGLRLPGPVDAAWDLAAAIVEFRLDDAAAALLVRRCAGPGRAEAAALAAAVEAYRPAYAALQLGDATLSLHEATTPGDRSRWAAEVARYRAALATALRRAAPDTAPSRRAA
ncbi:MAG TPA: hypothetical protein VF158_13520 [Longimicrobiales bacterium]